MSTIGLIALDTWVPTSRLPRAFGRLGASVVALLRSGAALANSRDLMGFLVFSGNLLADLEQLICAYRPEALVLCDHTAIREVYALIGKTDLSKDLNSLLRWSLGEPSAHKIVTSKWETAVLARTLNIPVPQQQTIDDAPSVARSGYPVVLKKEGTYGGWGTLICRSDRQTLANYVALRCGGFWRPLRRFPWLSSTLYRLTHNRQKLDSNSLIIQHYHQGMPAYTAAVAHEGEMLGALAFVAECVHPHPTGTSTVVAGIESPAMLKATEALIGATGYSGFISIDFLIGEDDGIPYLLEINPRIVNAVRFSSIFGVDLCNLFLSSFTKTSVCAQASVDPPVGRISFYPDEWLRDWRSPYLLNTPSDVPYEDPKLLAAINRTLPFVRRAMLSCGIVGTLPKAVPLSEPSALP